MLRVRPKTIFPNFKQGGYEPIQLIRLPQRNPKPFGFTFSMVLVVGGGDRAKLSIVRWWLGLISPAWSSPVKANFKWGLCWMTMNLSFSDRDCLDGTGETLLRP